MIGTLPIGMGSQLDTCNRRGKRVFKIHKMDSIQIQIVGTYVLCTCCEIMNVGCAGGWRANLTENQVQLFYRPPAVPTYQMLGPWIYGRFQRWG